jgi:cobalt-zinc-cadmium efflux system outer membrane protein
VKAFPIYLIVVVLVASSTVANGRQLASNPLSTERLTLNAALAEALEKNLELIAKRAGVSIAEATLLTARLRPNPVLSGGGDHLDLLGTGFNDENGAGPPEYSARVDFLLERGSKRPHRTEVAQEERGVAEADVLDAVRALRLDVEQAFVDVQLAQQNLAVARDNAKTFDEVVALNQARVRSGDVAEVELLRSRIAALQAQQAVRGAELKLLAERRRLERLIGRTPGTAPFEIEDIGPLAPVTSSVADLRARALRERPDLRSLQAARARSQAEMRLQLAQRQIDFAVGAEYRRQDGLAGRGNSLGVFFSTPLPVFDRNQGNIGRAKGEEQQAEVRVRQLEQVIAGEVDVAAAQFVTADVTLKTVETDMLTQARDVRAITDYAYRRGEATLIEFLDAQRAFNETMQAWNEARAEYARSVFLVRAAVAESGNPRACAALSLWPCWQSAVPHARRVMTPLRLRLPLCQPAPATSSSSMRPRHSSNGSR